jgi:hypothetical protein
MTYDFHKGLLAKQITKLTLREIKKNSNYFFEPIENVRYAEVDKEGKHFFYRKGEDQYLMFSYKYRTFIEKNGKLPSFHVCNCKTMKEYSGFVLASKMPVKVYCRNRNQELQEPQRLPLCGNCVLESQKGLYKMVARGKPWYDYVLDYASSNNKIAKTTKTDGYGVMWKQISEAVREKNNYCCNKCSLDLSDEKYFLEVHHIDKIKTNNQYNNLKPLCVLCHATVDAGHLFNFSKHPIKINSFIEKYIEHIRNHNSKNLKLWQKNS